MGGMSGGSGGSGGSMWGSLIQSGSALLQTGVGNYGYNKIKNELLDANTKAREARDKQYGETQGYLSPWADAGGRARDKMESYLGTDGKPYDEKNFQMDPGYQFRLNEGMKALQRSGSARGNLLSGGMMKALTGYAQGMASQEFNNAYNRLGSMANMGLNASGQMAGYSQRQSDQLGLAAENVGNINAAAHTAILNNWMKNDTKAADSWAGFFGSQPSSQGSTPSNQYGLAQLGGYNNDYGGMNTQMTTQPAGAGGQWTGPTNSANYGIGGVGPAYDGGGGGYDYGWSGSLSGLKD